MELLDQLAQDARIAGEYIAEKAVMAKDYTVATWNATTLRHKIDELYKAIGKAVYKAHRTGTDAEIQSYIDELEELRLALQQKEEERQSLRGRTLCPICDKPIQKGSTFCSHCGSGLK